MLRGHLVGGGKVINPDSRDRVCTSVHPAWRDTFIHPIATGVGGPSAAGLKVLAPDSGSYSNKLRDLSCHRDNIFTLLLSY